MALGCVKAVPAPKPVPSPAPAPAPQPSAERLYDCTCAWTCGGTVRFGGVWMKPSVEAAQAAAARAAYHWCQPPAGCEVRYVCQPFDESRPGNARVLP